MQGHLFFSVFKRNMETSLDSVMVVPSEDGTASPTPTRSWSCNVCFACSRSDVGEIVFGTVVIGLLYYVTTLVPVS